MFRAVPLSIIRSFSLWTQHWNLSYRFADSLRAESCSRAVSKPVWHIPLLFVQWITHDDGQRNCPKRVEFYSKNKFEKLVYLVGFITRNIRQFSYSASSYIYSHNELFQWVRTHMCWQPYTMWTTIGHLKTMQDSDCSLTPRDFWSFTVLYWSF